MHRYTDDTDHVARLLIELARWHKFELLLVAPLQLPHGIRQFIDGTQTPFGSKPDNWQQDQQIH